jgi:formate-nitrite transporter family protein
LRGVLAGWLLALMVWLMPFAESARIWVIVLVTYLVGLGEFSHVIAGSLSGFAWAWSEGGQWATLATEFCIPALIGNILGGTILVALLNHGQIAAGPGDGKV